MATPNARQIVFATSVVPKKTDNTTSTQETLEDGTTVGVAQYTDTILDTTIGKKFGGKGTVTIDADEREFIMTGYTPEDWDSIFPPEDFE